VTKDERSSWNALSTPRRPRLESLTDKEDIKQWSFDISEFAPRVGFESQFYGGDESVKYLHRCKVTEGDPREEARLHWRYEGYAGDSLVTFELFAQGKKTRLRLTHEGSRPSRSFRVRKKEFHGRLDADRRHFAEEFRRGKNTRGDDPHALFDAPRELMWKLWTEREHIGKWWGPKASRCRLRDGTSRRAARTAS